MMLRTFLAFVCFCSLLAAQEGRSGQGQEGRQGEESSVIERKMRAARERAAKGTGLSEAEIQGMSMEELDKLANRDVRHEPAPTSTSMCRFVASMKPNKLMPGQSGTMVVTAILTGTAVLPAPAPVERIGFEQQGLVQVGALSFRPADVGRLHPAYLGRPVYDNTAVFEVPITMAAGAEVGKKQPVALDLRFELFDGVTGQAIGKFVDRAVAEIEVGQAVDPAVRMPAAKANPTPAEPASSTPAPTKAVRGEAESAPRSKERIVEAQPARTVADAPSTPTAGAPDRSNAAPAETLDSSGDLPVLPIAIGGGLVLLVVVMLLARRK